MAPRIEFVGNTARLIGLTAVAIGAATKASVDSLATTIQGLVNSNATATTRLDNQAAAIQALTTEVNRVAALTGDRTYTLEIINEPPTNP